MTAFALALVLTSAVMHATWNLLAKRVNAGTPFLFLVYVVGARVLAEGQGRRRIVGAGAMVVGIVLLALG